MIRICAGDEEKKKLSFGGKFSILFIRGYITEIITLKLLMTKTFPESRRGAGGVTCRPQYILLCVKKRKEEEN